MFCKWEWKPEGKLAIETTEIFSTSPHQKGLLILSATGIQYQVETVTINSQTARDKYSFCTFFSCTQKRGKQRLLVIDSCRSMCLRIKNWIYGPLFFRNWPQLFKIHQAVLWIFSRDLRIRLTVCAVIYFGSNKSLIYSGDLKFCSLHYRS